jgi:pantoate--beta-alanine ligase
MLLIKEIGPLRHHLAAYRADGGEVGFVPTMGALHEGHLSLIERAKQQNALVVCSIFVNPTQFDNPLDLEKYPRTIERDISMLEAAHVDVLFWPSVSTMYPPDALPYKAFDFGLLDKVMEGAHRPGHFAGVAQVVQRLLDIVRPDRLYMGQKDFQQFSIVAAMLRQLASPIELVVCPIVREADGLAMSSRNVRLSPAMRQGATAISAALFEAKRMVATHSPREIIAHALAKMARVEGLAPEYFEIVDADKLQPIETFAGHGRVVACTAAFAGDVRLIDNEVLLWK